MNAHHRRRRNLNILRVALRRMISHAGPFTVVDIGSRIDGNLLPYEIPDSVSMLVVQLAAMGCLKRLDGDVYLVCSENERSLNELLRVSKVSDRRLETLAAPPALSKLDRLLGSDVFGEEPATGEGTFGL